MAAKPVVVKVTGPIPNNRMRRLVLRPSHPPPKTTRKRPIYGRSRVSQINW